MLSGIKHIIFDLNGTLADTKRAFLYTRNYLVDSLVALTGESREILLSEVRVFLAGNSLNPDIARKLPAVVRWEQGGHSGEVRDARSRLLDDVTSEFRSEVKRAYRLDTANAHVLTSLKSRGISLSIWSGSRAPYVIDMVLLLGLDGVIDYVFCPSQKEGVQTSLDAQQLDSTRLIEFGPDMKKPCVRTLLHIVATTHVPEAETILVGNGILSDGMSTIGTAVRFVHLRTPDLTPQEVELADLLTGTESKRRSEAEAQLTSQVQEMDSFIEIDCLNDIEQVLRAIN